MDAEFLIPISISLGLFAMIFGIFYIRNRERMAMIERGMDPRSYKAQPAPYQNLKWGLLLVGAGTGLLLAYFLDQYILPVNRDYSNDSRAFIYFALLGIGGGLGLIRSYSVEKKELLNKRDRTEL